MTRNRNWRIQKQFFAALFERARLTIQELKDTNCYVPQCRRRTGAALASEKARRSLLARLVKMFSGWQFFQG
jgi:hypothetical protein